MTEQAPKLSKAEQEMLDEIREICTGAAAGAIGVEVRSLSHPAGINCKVVTRLLSKGVVIVTRHGEEVTGEVDAGDYVSPLYDDEPAEQPEQSPPADKPPEVEPEPPRRMTRTLPCKLTTDEVVALGDEIDALLAESEEVEDEKKSTASEFTSRLNRIAERVRKLSNQRRSRSVEREVEIVKMQDPIRAVEETYRVDTGTLVETLTRDELAQLRQLTIDGTAEV